MFDQQHYSGDYMYSWVQWRLLQHETIHSFIISAMSVDRHCKEGRAQASQGSAKQFIMLKKQVRHGHGGRSDIQLSRMNTDYK